MAASMSGVSPRALCAFTSDLGRLQQRKKDPVGFELQRQQQAFVAAFVGRVGVEATAQQVGDGGGVVADDGREEVVIRAGARPCVHRKK